MLYKFNLWLLLFVSHFAHGQFDKCVYLVDTVRIKGVLLFDKRERIEMLLPLSNMADTAFLTGSYKKYRRFCDKNQPFTMVLSGSELKHNMIMDGYDGVCKKPIRRYNELADRIYSKELTAKTHFFVPIDTVCYVGFYAPQYPLQSPKRNFIKTTRWRALLNRFSKPKAIVSQYVAFSTIQFCE